MENEEEDDDVASGYPAPCMMTACLFRSQFICVFAIRASGAQFVKMLKRKVEGTVSLASGVSVEVKD